nr:MAG TPA: hypothetical protein [Caudoviricetes sp.]
MVVLRMYAAGYLSQFVRLTKKCCLICFYRSLVWIIKKESIS